MELGEKLKQNRTAAGLKQEDLAQKIGVSRQTVSSWENNRSYPDIASLLKLSDLYGLSLDEMLKEDRNLRAHYETKAEKRKKFWQLALEYSLVVQIIGILLAGQDFQNIGYGLQIIAAVCTWISLWMHIKLFDHTREEISRFAVGFTIIMAGSLWELLFPDFISSTSIWLALFYLVRSAGPLLVLFSNVWQHFWKSPRFWIILLFLIGVPFLNLANAFQSTGSFNVDSPFPQDYRIEEVLYPESEEADPEVRIDLYTVLNEHRLRIYKNGDDYSSLGAFTYQEPSDTQTEKGIWVLTPENDSSAVYRVAVEADDSVTLSYSENQQLRWKWLLREEYAAGLHIATFGHDIFSNPNWYLPKEADPEPYFKHSDVIGEATMTITLHGLETQTLPLLEEYHNGDHVEYSQYQILPEKPGSYVLELKTRYDGKQEYALYRIPYRGGEFRFALTFEQGSKEAFRDLLKNG